MNGHMLNNATKTVTAGALFVLVVASITSAIVWAIKGISPSWDAENRRLTHEAIAACHERGGTAHVSGNYLSSCAIPPKGSK
jgi:hypothetical protein